MIPSTLLDRAKEVVTRVNEEYSDETFVSEGYGYFDDMTKAMAGFAAQVRAEALDEAVLAAQSCQPYQPELESDLLNEAAERIKALKVK